MDGQNDDNDENDDGENNDDNDENDDNEIKKDKSDEYDEHDENDEISKPLPLSSSVRPSVKRPVKIKWRKIILKKYRSDSTDGRTKI